MKASSPTWALMPGRVRGPSAHWWLLPFLAWILVACRTAEPSLNGPYVVELSLPAGEIVLDPQRDVTGRSASITSNLFAGLMYADPETGEALPDLAATPPDISPDGLTYTFTIRQNVVWVGPDGSPVAPLIADDMVFAIRRLCDNSTVASLATPFYIIKNCREANETVGTADLEAIAVRAIDEQIVEFTLNEAASYFPLLLTHWAARPLPTQWVIQGESWSDPARLVSSGPFRLDALDPQRGVRLLRNPHFPAADTISLSEVNLAFAQDELDPLRAYIQNLLDSAPVPHTLVAAVQGDAALEDQVLPIFGTCTTYVGFTSVKAPLDNRDVRLALSQAIDREALVAIGVPGQAVPARFMTPPGFFGAPTGERIGVSSNLGAARDLLARAGYAGGQGVPPITLAYLDEGNNALLAGTLEGMWEEGLGLDVTLVALDPTTADAMLSSTISLGQMPHAWLRTHCGAFPDAYAWLAPTFAVGKSPNYARRVPTRFETLLEQAAAEPDANKRRELYARIEQELVVEDADAAPLFHAVTYVVIKPWLAPVGRPFGGTEYRGWTIEMGAKLRARATSTEAMPTP